MKKFRFLCLILVALLLVQAGVMPALATEVDTNEQTENTTEVTEESSDTIPQDFPGDASVEYGCKTLDAAYPLADTNDYKAKAKAALAYDVNSDTLIWAQDADVKLYPASLTKIMTALLTIENITDFDAIVTIRGETIRGLDPTGSNAALKNGEQMSVRDLLYCLMIPSANDAAMVLAEYVGGDVDTFVEMMNARAAELGCTGTHFANPHGLHDDDHYTTARDIAKIMKAALDLELFVEIDSTVTYTVPATNLSEERVLTTTNRMMYQSTYPNVYDSRVISGKTGFTTPAGRCLVAVSQSGSMKLITVVMGCTATYGSDGYSYVRYGNFEESSKIMDFVYGTYTGMQILSQDQVLGEFEVEDGANHAFGQVSSTVRAVVPKGTTYQDVRYDYVLNGQTLTAPLAAGDAIGAVRVWLDDRCIAQETLYSASAVSKDAVKFSGTTAVDTFDASIIWKGLLVVLAVIIVLVVIGRIRRNLRRAAQRRKRRRRTAAAVASAQGTRNASHSGAAQSSTRRSSQSTQRRSSQSTQRRRTGFNERDRRTRSTDRRRRG